MQLATSGMNGSSPEGMRLLRVQTQRVNINEEVISDKELFVLNCIYCIDTVDAFEE